MIQRATMDEKTCKYAYSFVRGINCIALSKWLRNTSGVTETRIAQCDLCKGEIKYNVPPNRIIRAVTCDKCGKAAVSAHSCYELHRLVHVGMVTMASCVG